MENYIPDIYQKSIYTIDYNKLKNRGIKCILFDLDNTLVPVNIKEVNRKLKDLFDDLKSMGFRIAIFSNSTKNRIKPFKDELGVDGWCFVCKPFRKKFLQALKQYNCKENEVAIIGDQILTDILGGNKVGITTVLINPISKKDFFFTRFNRMREKRIMTKLRKHNLFVKGRYYE